MQPKDGNNLVDDHIVKIAETRVLQAIDKAVLDLGNLGTDSLHRQPEWGTNELARTSITSFI